MRAKEFLLEYNRQLTAQKIGSQLLAVANKDMSYRRIQHLQTTPEEFQIDDRWLPDVIDRIEAGDPTPNKIYVPWLAREYIKGNIRRIEDMSMFTRPLTVFETYKKRRDFPQHIKDIMRLTSLQFYNAMSQFTPPAEILKDKGRSTQVYKDANVRVIVPEDQTAACYYGQGTTWCTAATQSTNYFNQYNRQGKMYILLPGDPKHDGEKYQIHPASYQYMDEDDEPVNVQWLLTKRFPQLFEFFMAREPELKSLVIFSDDQTLMKIGEQIRDIAMGFVHDLFMEWQDSDDGFREWQSEQAIEKGYVDKDGDIDWDLVMEDDSINDYADYNSEAADFYNNAAKALKLTPTEMRQYAETMVSAEYDGDEEPVTYQSLEDVYAFSVEDLFGGSSRYGSNDHGLSRMIKRNISIDKNGKVAHVRR
jgi:hypothetical protein